MESEPQIPTQICGDDEEFYEKIEAPKFVDFTVPDHYRPDDRFWFCLRVGCDRKHEEEIDHEAISKDFVLRVMAARSPNVRLRKILNRNTYSIKDKCPLSAPAKPTKSRLSKLAVTSSISQKIIDTKANTKPITKLTSTPKLPKGKQVAAKYLTTPRHKICPQNTNNSFRSVQNPKPTNIAVPKNKTVAKSLFQSPKKKGICVKTSAELRTPLTKICAGIKKLEITSQRKRVLGYSSKPKEIKDKSICKDKSKGSSLSRPLNTKEQKSKSLRDLKRKSIENESSGVEIDMKSRIIEKNTNTALAEAYEMSMVEFKEGKKISKENLEEEKAYVEKIGNPEEQPMKSENLENSEDNTSTALADAFEISMVKFEEGNEIINKNLEEEKAYVENIENPEEQPLKSENLENDEDNTSTALADAFEISMVKFEEGNKIIKENLEEEKAYVEKIENPEEQPLKSENLENDDKENALAPDYNRSCGRNTPGKSEMKVNKKVVKTQDGNLKEGLKAAVTSAQVGKYKKPKPTNPKPFRLRTDERGVLREANMERKAPLKESEAVSKNENEIEKQIRPAERSGEDQKSRQKVPNTMNLQKRSNLAKHREKDRNILGEISEKSTRKTKSPSLQPHFMMPIGGASTRKTNVSDVKTDNKLTPIKETLSVEAGERSHSLKSVSKGKKAKTVAEVEKSCVRKVSWAAGV